MRDMKQVTDFDDKSYHRQPSHINGPDETHASSRADSCALVPYSKAFMNVQNAYT